METVKIIGIITVICLNVFYLIYLIDLTRAIKSAEKDINLIMRVIAKQKELNDKEDEIQRLKKEIDGIN